MILVKVVKQIEVNEIEIFILLVEFYLGKDNITCRDIRRMGSAISALSSEQISSISDDVLFQCIGAFGEVNDYNPDRVKQIAQKYIQV